MPHTHTLSLRQEFHREIHERLTAASCSPSPTLTLPSALCSGVLFRLVVGCFRFLTCFCFRCRLCTPTKTDQAKLAAKRSKTKQSKAPGGNCIGEMWLVSRVKCHVGVGLQWELHDSTTVSNSEHSRTKKGHCSTVLMHWPLHSSHCWCWCCWCWLQW